MCAGEVGTVPAAGSVGAFTCGLDRQWGRRGRRGRCDGQRWGSVEGCPGRKASGGEKFFALAFQSVLQTQRESAPIACSRRTSYQQRGAYIAPLSRPL